MPASRNADSSHALPGFPAGIRHPRLAAQVTKGHPPAPGEPVVCGHDKREIDRAEPGDLQTVLVNGKEEDAEVEIPEPNPVGKRRRQALLDLELDPRQPPARRT